MYAIVEIAGHQYKVNKDQKIFVNRLNTKEGKSVTLNKVLLIEDSGKVKLGAPLLEGAQVNAKVLKHLKGDKVIVFKKKRRKGYRVKNGHRQALTQIVIDKIITSGVSKKVNKEVLTTIQETNPKTSETPQDLSSLTVAKLKEMAKVKNIKGVSSMKKADLIAALS